MRLYDRLRLSECAICSYAVKKFKGKLQCDWDEKKKNLKSCSTIKECGNFKDWFNEI